MNADQHIADDLKKTCNGKLFAIFGEPDVSILLLAGGNVNVNGVRVFDLSTDEVRSDRALLYCPLPRRQRSLQRPETTLNAEINGAVWSTLHSDTSSPFEKPKSGCVAVKMIDRRGNTGMRVMEV